MTWDIAETKKQRGCIGTFWKAPLSKSLVRFAIVSALEDHREVPISLSELPALECTVSLLHSFEEAADPNDWTVGTHGLQWELSHGGKAVHFIRQALQLDLPPADHSQRGLD